MSDLFLVRHGQTRGFLVDGYTDLTDVGVRQAQALGAWFEARGIVPTRVVVGPRPRHVQTLSGLVRPGWPEAVPLDVLDEHAGMDAMKALLAAEADAPPGLREAVLAGLQTPDQRGVMASFRLLMGAWVEGRLQIPGVESWEAFRARVGRALDQLCAGPSGQTVVAVTSGGVVGCAVADVLGVTSDLTAEALAFAVENTSVTSLRYSGPRRSLHRFNVVSHLGLDVPETAV